MEANKNRMNASLTESPPLTDPYGVVRSSVMEVCGCPYALTSPFARAYRRITIDMPIAFSYTREAQFSVMPVRLLYPSLILRKDSVRLRKVRKGEEQSR